MRDSDLWQRLKPYAMADMRAIGTAGGRNTVSGGVATMAAHELASTSALGAYHTVSGLTAGQVLRATGSSTAAFGQLNHNQLGGIGANDHHAQIHSITGSDHTLTASQYQVVGATATNTLGLLTPSADVSGGATALLRSNAGALSVATLTAGTKVTTPTLDTASGNLTVAPAGDLILDPVGNDVLPNANYDINLGMLNKKYLTLHAAELWVETLVAQNTIATIGGRILVGPTTTLTSDLPSGDTTIYVKHNQMVNGDRVYMEANGNVEFMAITSGPSGSGPYSYSVARNQDGSGANTWHAGDAIFNTGQTGDGFIDIYSVRGVRSATEYGPTIVGNRRNSLTYNDWSPRWALGNLNGVYGYSATTPGFAAGNYAASWVAADATNGIRIMSGSTARLQADASGNLRLYNSSGTSTIALDSDGTSYFAGPMTIGTSGGIYQGTGTFASPTTGLKIWRDSSIGRIGGYKDGTLQWYADTNGVLTAGGGNAFMDANGISTIVTADPYPWAATGGYTIRSTYGGTIEADFNARIATGSAYWRVGHVSSGRSKIDGVASSAAVNLTMSGGTDSYLTVASYPNKELVYGDTAVRMTLNSGSMTLAGDLIVGSSDSSPGISVGSSYMSTGEASIDLGQARTGSGYAYIDLIGDTTYSDYGLRVIRGNGGANTSSAITHRGTGDFNIQATEAAALKLRTNNTLRVTVQSTGEMLTEYGLYVNGDQGGISGYVGITDVTTGINTGTGTVRMNSTSAGVASAGWLKIYVGTTTAYIPYWTSMT